MGFEVCGCGGLWVTCGSGTVVVMAIGGDYWVVVVVICWVVMDFFFFKVVLVDVGLCQWWLSVLLRQWWLWASLIWMGFEICECGGLLWIFFSGCGFFFFFFCFKVALVDMCLCQWWPSVLLR